MEETQTTTALIPEDVATFLRELKETMEAESVESVTISTDVEYRNTGEAIKMLKDNLRQVEDDYKVVKEPILEQTREIDAEFRPVKKLLKDRIEKFSHALGEYDDLKQLEAESAAEEAQSEIDLEREKLNRQIEGALEKAADYKAKNRANLAVKWAQRARDLERKKEALVPVPIDAGGAPTVEGLSTMGSWVGVCTDIAAFARWCLDTDNAHLLLPDQKKLDLKAKEYNGQKEIPGVEWKKKYGTRKR